MSRGRTAEWADKPLAQWIRGHLESRGKNKKWLAERLAERRGTSVTTASRSVTRWTFGADAPATAVTLDPDYVTALRDIFADDPPGTPGAIQDQSLARLEALVQRYEEIADRLGTALEDREARPAEKAHGQP